MQQFNIDRPKYVTKVVTTAKPITMVRDDKKIIIPEGSKVYSEQYQDDRYFGRMYYWVLTNVGNGAAFLTEPVSYKEYLDITAFGLFDDSKMEFLYQPVCPPVEMGPWPSIAMTLSEKIAFLAVSRQRYDVEGLGVDPICVLLDEYIRRVRQVVHYPKEEQKPFYYRQLMKEAFPELWARRPLLRNRNTGCWWPAYTERGNRKRADLCFSLWRKLTAEGEKKVKPVKMNDW
jgi:hypothetical protein